MIKMPTYRCKCGVLTDFGLVCVSCSYLIPDQDDVEEIQKIREAEEN
jgi:hypothetical protein